MTLLYNVLKYKNLGNRIYTKNMLGEINFNLALGILHISEDINHSTLYLNTSEK